MILDDKNLEQFAKTYDVLPTRYLCWLKCDYCGKEFTREKKSRNKLNKIVNKDSCGQKSCSNNKREEISFIQCGYKSRFTSPDFKDKTKETNIKKYGTETYFGSSDFKTKRKSKLIERYGVDSPLKNDEIKNKQRSTCNDRLGVSNPSESADIIKKRSNNNVSKYGCQPSQLPEIQEKRANTCISKYGHESFTQTNDYKIKLKETSLKNYGTEHPLASEEVRNKIEITMKERYGVSVYSQSPEFKEKFTSTCMARYGVPNALCLQKNRQFGKTEHEIRDWLNSFGFSFKTDYSVLGGKEIDLYDANKNFAIEYCGLYWHTENSLEPRTKYYHYNKYKICGSKNIRLITMFEDEWKNRNLQCQDFLKASLGIFDKRFHARELGIINLPAKEAHQFLDNNHIQGKPINTLCSFALHNNNELLGVMTLGRHHRDVDKVALTRMAFKQGIQIIGGTSRLLSRCKEWLIANNHHELISWSDNRWSAGNVYIKSGFILDTDFGPDYSYVNLAKPYIRLSKQSQKKSNTGCPKDKTEREWAAEHGLARIWDCGKKRWKLNIQ